MNIEKQFEQKAWAVFKLSMKRVGIRCPGWARTSKMRRKFIKIYKKAARKNHFRFAYGKDGEFYEVDHIVPLHGENVSGLHVPWNLKVIPKTINRAKGILIVEEWQGGNFEH